MIALLLLAAGGLALLASAGWAVIQLPRAPRPVKADPIEVVRAFHLAMNGDDADAMLNLFAADATVRAGRSTLHGRDEIRKWVELLQPGRTIHSEAVGETVYWRDIAGSVMILEWTAVIREGRINSLTLWQLPAPDRK
jgi:hypothetical protein